MGRVPDSHDGRPGATRRRPSTVRAPGSRERSLRARMTGPMSPDSLGERGPTSSLRTAAEVQTTVAHRFNGRYPPAGLAIRHRPDQHSPGRR